jgi:hypothetical protein
MNGDRPRLRVTEWRALNKNTLRGFASIALPNGLVIRDVSVHSKGGKHWASLPSKPMLDSAGSVLRDEAGKIKYAAILQWGDRTTANKFSAAVVQALLARFPDALTVEPS